jgi:tetratricopeptide (TPR) repeat protein
MDLLCRLVLLWAALGARGAWAAEGPDTPAASGPAPADAWATRLDDAVRAYQLGQRDDARSAFAALAVEPEAPAALRQEARVYLGELLYTEGDEDGARRFFEQVLLADPAYTLDPFTHPPDVCGYFDYVRAYLGPAKPPPVEPPPPVPVRLPATPPSAFLPLGVYQLREGRTGAGLGLLGSQLAFVGSNAALWVLLALDHSYTAGDAAEERRLKAMRAWTGVTAAGFYTSWVWGMSDATRHWRRVAGPRAMQAQQSAGPPPSPPAQ